MKHSLNLKSFKIIIKELNRISENPTPAEIKLVEDFAFKIAEYQTNRYNKKHKR